MALLNAMQKQQDPDAQQDMTGINDPDAAGDMGREANPDQQGDMQRGAGGNVAQVAAGMLSKLFPDQDLMALVDLLKQHQGQAVSTVVDSIVGGIIGLLKQGQQQGKTLPVKAIMGALLPMIGKMAQAVETDEQRGAALLAELLTKIGQKLAQQGGQAGVLDQAQAQELQQLVQAFTDKVAPHFNGGQPQQGQPQPPQPQQPMM